MVINSIYIFISSSAVLAMPLTYGKSPPEKAGHISLVKWIPQFIVLFVSRKCLQKPPKACPPRMRRPCNGSKAASQRVYYFCVSLSASIPLTTAGRTRKSSPHHQFPSSFEKWDDLIRGICAILATRPHTCRKLRYFPDALRIISTTLPKPR